MRCENEKIKSAVRVSCISWVSNQLVWGESLNIFFVLYKLIYPMMYFNLIFNYNVYNYMLILQNILNIFMNIDNFKGSEY